MIAIVFLDYKTDKETLNRLVIVYTKYVETERFSNSPYRHIFDNNIKLIHKVVYNPKFIITSSMTYRITHH